MKPLRTAVLTSHPIQYQAPWFRAASACGGLDLEVFFCHQPAASEQGDGFGVPFDWDVPLLDGYRYRFLRNVAATPSLGLFSGLDTPEIREIIARRRFDAVIVNGWHYKSAWQAIRACWATHTPVMVRGDSHLRTERHSLKRFLKLVPYRWFIPKFDACLAAGKWSSDYFLHYGARRERIFVVPHVIDEARFSAECLGPQSSRAGLRDKWRINQDHVVFAFVGKFIGEKRPRDFVRAIALAARGKSTITGLMAGDGPLRHECERLALEAGAPVRFTGFLNQSQIAQVYVACDALVLPSDSETWGLAVHEAMACGRPSIVSDRVGCGPDLVSHGDTGFVFSCGNVEELANLMLSCTALGFLQLGERARRRVAAYSASAAAGALLRAAEAVSAADRGFRA